MDFINRHNELVRTNSGDRLCYRNTCANCGESDKKQRFAPHELRRRSLRYIVDNRVESAVIWLARWKCRNCDKIFTDYPDFRTPL